MEIDGKSYAFKNGVLLGQMVDNEQPVAENSNAEEELVDCSNLSIEQQILVEIQKMNLRLDKIENGLQHQTQQMTEFSEFVLAFKKFMRLKPTASDEHSIHDEDFAEFKQMKRIETEIELEQFEQKLNEEPYIKKLKKYLQQKFELNAKQDANAFFKVLVRQFVAPQALMAFSWKGVQRATKNDAAVSQNKSFKANFPNFVDFIDSVLFIADCQHKSEHIELYFDTYLRSKNKELKREAERNEKNALPRKVASRSYKRRLNDDNNDDADEDEHIEMDENKRSKPDQTENAEIQDNPEE